MELFAYISLEDLDKILRGNHDEVGKRFDEDSNRVSSHNCREGVNYVELFDDLKNIGVLQQYNAGKPEYHDGGVLVRVNIPKRLIVSHEGVSIYKVEEKGQEKYLELKTYPVESKYLRTDNFVDAVFDRECSSTVEEIEGELNFKYSPRSMGE
jgi:hypothetical protein